MVLNECLPGTAGALQEEKARHVSCQEQALRIDPTSAIESETRNFHSSHDRGNHVHLLDVSLNERALSLDSFCRLSQIVFELFVIQGIEPRQNNGNIAWRLRKPKAKEIARRIYGSGGFLEYH